MAQLKIKKLSALPSTLEAHTVYYIPDGPDHYIQYVTNADGTVASRAYADAKSVKFPVYTLPQAVSTGVMDLSKNQIYRVTPGTGAQVAVSFTNIPTESQTIVIEVVGKAGGINFPASVTVCDGVDPTLGTVLTIMTLFWNGSKFYMVNATKVNS